MIACIQEQLSYVDQLKKKLYILQIDPVTHNQGLKCQIVTEFISLHIMFYQYSLTFY